MTWDPVRQVRVLDRPLDEAPRNRRIFGDLLRWWARSDQPLWAAQGQRAGIGALSARVSARRRVKGATSASLALTTRCPRLPSAVSQVSPPPRHRAAARRSARTSHHGRLAARPFLTRKTRRSCTISRLGERQCEVRRSMATMIDTLVSAGVPVVVGGRDFDGNDACATSRPRHRATPGASQRITGPTTTCFTQLTAQSLL